MYVHPHDFCDARDAKLAKLLSEKEYQGYLDSQGQELKPLFQFVGAIFGKISNCFKK